MKKIGFLCLLTIIQWSLFGQSFVKGNIYENPTCSKEDQRRPVAGATISADGAETISSKSDGSFTLHFPHKQPNVAVKISISKEGYPTKNNLVTTCGQCGTEFIIFCSNKSASNPTRVTQIIKDDAENRKRQEELDVLIAQAKKNSEEQKKLVQEKDGLEKEQAFNKEEIRRLSSQAKEKDWAIISNQMIDMLSAPNFKQPDSKQKTIYDEEFFNALDLLWDSNKTEDTDSLTKTGELSRAREIKKNEWKAYYYTIDNQFDKAAQCYQTLLRLDSDNLDYLYSYVIFLNLLNKKDEAIAQLEKALNAKLGTKIMQVKMSNLLAGIYIRVNQPDKAKAVLDKGTNIYESISKDTSQYVDKKQVEAKLYELYGLLYYLGNQFDNALFKYKASKDVFVGLNARQDGEYKDNVAGANTKLAKVYSSIKNYNEALRLYNESLLIYDELWKKDSNDTYFLSRCEVALDMANLYYARNDFKTAKKLYDQLDFTFKKLAAEDPERFEEYLAQILFAEGKMDHDQKQYGFAENKFTQVLDIYTKLNEGEDERDNYNAQIASTLNNRGKSLFARKQMARCKKDFDTALAINLALAKRAPETYEPSLADSYSLLASYFSSVNKDDSTYYYCDKALKISQKFDKKDKRVYRLGLIQNTQSMASYHFSLGDKESAIKEMDDAYRMAQELVKIDTAVFLPDFASAVLTLGMVYMNEDENKFAIKKFEEAYNIFERLSREQADVYELQKATSQWALGTLYESNNDDKSALNCFEKAINICKKQLQYNEVAYAPILAEVNLSKANINQKNENYPDALKYLEESKQWLALLLANNGPDEYKNQLGNVQIQVAQICIITKEYQRAENNAIQARERFNQLMKSDPDNKNIYLSKMATIEKGSATLNLARGRMLDALDNFRNAESYFKNLRNVSPPEYQVEECKTKISIGEIQQSMDHDQIAMQDFKSVVDTISNILRYKPEYEQNYLPTLAKAYSKLGTLNFENAPIEALDNYAKSVELYKKIKATPENNYKSEIAIIYLNDGIIYFNMPKYKEAISYLEQALQSVQTDPGSPNGLIVRVSANRILGETHYRTGDYDEARKYFSKCLELEQQFEGSLSKIEILELKEHAGISYIRSSEGDHALAGEKILREAKRYGSLQNWPPEQSQQVSKIIQEICTYIECN